MTMSVDDLVQEWKQWMIDANNFNPGDFVIPKSSFRGPADRNYNLKNRLTKKFLQWERQTFGINLGWTDNAQPDTARRVARWFFTRDGSPIDGIRYGEVIAVGNGNNPSFIRYEERAIGINLGWSDSPKFEWKILGGKLGQPVKTGEWIALFNMKSEGGEPLIYFDRTKGGDIGWPSSQTWGERALDIIKEEGWRILKEEAIKVIAA